MAEKKRKKTNYDNLRRKKSRLNPTNIDFDEVNDDVYEYEEQQAEEESKKNNRYDPVSVKDDLPSDFEDEHVQSDDDDDYGYIGKKRDENAHSDDSGKEDKGRHVRMLQEITGMPSEAFEENKKMTMKDAVIPELYPEFEYNPSRDVVDGHGHISIEDLLNPLRENPDYAKLRRRTQQIEKNARTICAPLREADQSKVDRKAAYKISKKHVTKWQPIIQRNREAPTIFFDEKVDLGFSTIGAIASAFKPRTEFERKVAALVHNDKLVEAHKRDGSKLLEMNKVSIDENDRQSHIAKMRSLLLCHEKKAKRIKKIKSKTYHQLLKKDKLKSESSRIKMDPEAAKEYAMKQHFRRAEERMTLKYTNRNPWAKHAKQHDLDYRFEGTRAAMDEHHRRHNESTRKVPYMMGSRSSNSDDSNDEESDEDSAGSDHDSKLLGKFKEQTMNVLEEMDETPKSGLLSLPFMRRGLKKSKEAVIEEYKDALKDLEDLCSSKDPKAAFTSGRRVFGLAKIFDAGDKVRADTFYNNNSDNEDYLGASKSINIENGERDLLWKDASNNDADTHKEFFFKNLDEITKSRGPRTTYDVSIFGSDIWKKARSRNDKDTDIKKPEPVRQDIKHTEKVLGEGSDTDSEGHMVDGILTSTSKSRYELPSQEELIRQAFAGDDVEDDFEKDKQEILNEENPEPEKPILLPGWGQWTHTQQKKGLPSWMLKKYEGDLKKRDEALKKRNDAHLKNVIISEKLNKKAEKLYTKVLPYPFTFKEVFEQTMRMPIGPECNPASAIGALNRPEVVKRPGVIIKPIEFEV